MAYHLEPGTAEEIFDRVRSTSNHQSYLDRAYRCAQMTVPSLLTENQASGRSGPSRSIAPAGYLHQGIGARGVNNLAAKLLLVLLPAGGSMFKLVPSDYRIKAQLQVENQGREEVLTELEHQLAQIERELVRHIDKTNDRSCLFECVRHLIVTGNGLLYMGPEKLRFFPLFSYVQELDGDGSPRCVVVRESISRNKARSLGVKIKERTETEGPVDTENLCLYTVVEWDHEEKLVCWWQECEGQAIGDEQEEPLDASPWLPMGLYQISGEHYSHGFCEDLYGDLVTVNQLSKSLIDGAAAAARLLFLVNPNGVTNVDALNSCPNGGFAPGIPSDVAALQMQKNGDFQTVFEVVARTEQRLSLQFLLNSSAIRQSERTTAEEVRMVAQELEAGLGGIYAQLANQFQRPYINRKLKDLQAAGKLPALPEGLVDIRITTGVDAIGRGEDAQAMMTWLGSFNQALSGNAGAFLKPIPLGLRLAAAFGVDAYSVMKSEQDITQEQQQAMQAQQAQLQAQDPANDPQKLAAANKLNTEADLMRQSNGAGSSGSPANSSGQGAPPG